MAKYLVIADTYQRGYGVTYYLFGIFDTKKEAVKWVIDNPVVQIEDSAAPYSAKFFDFFEDYEEGKGLIKYIREKPLEPLQKTYIQMTKEEFVLRYIEEFEGTHKPLYIGGYVE